MKVCLACGQRFEADDWRCPGCGQSPELHNGYFAFSPDLAETSDGFSAEYFTQLAKLEAGHFWFRSRNRLLIWALRRYFPHASSFLEIGCGTGFVLSGIRQEFPELMLGSYPRIGEKAYRVLLTLESRDEDYLERALASLLERLPEDAIHRVE